MTARNIIPKVLVVVAAMGAATAVTYVATRHFHKQETEQLTSQIATLNANIEAIGPIETCYTVLEATYPGQEITASMLVAQSIPSSLKNDSFATADDIVGLYSKISITPGTPITKDMVMGETITDSLREIDLTVNRWPIGLRTGDYVDVRLTYPRGEDYIVLTHKRVMALNDQTLKLYLTEEEQALYQAALVDFYVSRSYGSDIYVTKYIEPGVQSAAEAYYSVPANIAAVMAINPNVVKDAMVSVDKALRDSINTSLTEFAGEDSSGTEIKAGRDELNAKVNSDFVAYEDEMERMEATAENADESDSGIITDIGSGVY